MSETELSPEMKELQEKVLRLQMENSLLNQELVNMQNWEKKRMEDKVYFKKSEKGGIQIMGIRRFPITLYRREIEMIFKNQNRIEEFMNKNEINQKEIKEGKKIPELLEITWGFFYVGVSDGCVFQKKKFFKNVYII